MRMHNIFSGSKLDSQKNDAKDHKSNLPSTLPENFSYCRSVNALSRVLAGLIYDKTDIQPDALIDEKEAKAVREKDLKFLDLIKAPILAKKYPDAGVFLNCAAYYGFLETIAFLLAEKAENSNCYTNLAFSVKTDYGFTGGRADDLLKSIGIDIDELTTRFISSYTPMQLAAIKGHQDVVSLLQKHNVQIEQSLKAYPILYWFAERSYHQAMYIYINLGANLEGRDSWGNTALHRSAFYQDLNGAKILIYSGAAIMAISKQMGTPMQVAALKDDDNAKLMIAYLEQERRQKIERMHVRHQTFTVLQGCFSKKKNPFSKLDGELCLHIVGFFGDTLDKKNVAYISQKVFDNIEVLNNKNVSSASTVTISAKKTFKQR